MYNKLVRVRAISTLQQQLGQLLGCCKSPRNSLSNAVVQDLEFHRCVLVAGDQILVAKAAESGSQSKLNKHERVA